MLFEGSLLFEEGLEAGRKRRQPVGHDPVQDVIAVAMALEQPGLGQRAQVLGQRRLGDPDERGEFLGAARPFGDQAQSA